MYTYQTGKFSHRSSRGNKYQMILHEIDGKSTWIEPMKNMTEVGMILAWRCALERMKKQGIVPMHQVLYNEVSAAYRLKINKTSMTFQLVPPYYHRWDLA